MLNCQSQCSKVILIIIINRQNREVFSDFYLIVNGIFICYLFSNWCALVCLARISCMTYPLRATELRTIAGMALAVSNYNPKQTQHMTLSNNHCICINFKHFMYAFFFRFIHLVSVIVRFLNILVFLSHTHFTDFIQRHASKNKKIYRNTHQLRKQFVRYFIYVSSNF